MVLRCSSGTSSANMEELLEPHQLQGAVVWGREADGRETVDA